MQLFHDLLENQQIEQWVPLLDWLLSNDRFNPQKGWGQKHNLNFTTQLKAIVGTDNWLIQAAKTANWEFEKSDNPQIIMNKGGSEGASFVRHIRNAIAHGKVQIEKQNNKLYIEIKDYHDNSCRTQTAHIWIPAELLFDAYRLYMKIQEQIPSRT